MRLRLSFRSPNPIKLPTTYLQQVQGLIYRHMNNPSMQEFLHDYGFQLGKRKFKLFVYSGLFGNFHYNAVNKIFTFTPPVHMYLSSPWDDFVQSFVNGVAFAESISLGGNALQLDEIKVEKTPDFNEQKVYKIKMLSPVTVYSTLTTALGGKKTYYYAPTEKDFLHLIRQNLIKKAHAFYGEDWSQRPFGIEPIGKVLSKQQKIIKFKDTIIKAWLGRFYLYGDAQMLKLAYEGGIGAKNSQSFGMFALEDEE